ncbi:MAG: hypothetical protein H0U09_12505 [Geodermatophilaceae bacterium]|nr:hypothetical protein [Geodermatophilaceae bacterium]
MDESREFIERAKPFAEAIAPLASALSTAALEPRQQKALREAIEQVIRKCHDAVLPIIRPAGASASARSLATELAVDLAILRWGQEPRNEHRQKLLHLDHITPVSWIRVKCVDAPSASAIRQVLHTYLHAAWITPAENAELNRLKYRSKRPDPRAAYREQALRWTRGRPNLPLPECAACHLLAHQRVDFPVIALAVSGRCRSRYVRSHRLSDDGTATPRESQARGRASNRSMTTTKSAREWS